MPSTQKAKCSSGNASSMSSKRLWVQFPCDGIIFAKIKREGQDASQPGPAAPRVRCHAVGGTASPHH